jgi:hypothetical protein
MSGFFSKFLTSFTGVQNDTEPQGFVEKGGDPVVAESSSVPTNTGRFIPATTDVIDTTGGLPTKRRKTATEERKRLEEKKREMEMNINEWKRSLTVGYEFDHFEVWPYPQGQIRCKLPENHLSTKTMYEKIIKAPKTIK